MKQFFRQNGLVLLIISFLLSVLISIYAAYTGTMANPISSAVRTLLTPVQTASATMVSWVESVSDYVLHYDDLNQELEELRLQVAELETEIRDAEDANRENELYRQVLELKEKRSDFVLESARVSVRTTSNWDEILTISKGSSSGIEVGDCVITAEGYLLGVVYEVSSSSSSVYTIVDTRMEMGGQVSRTYYSGILEGDFSLMTQGKLKLSYLSDDAQLLPGDVVVTSGMGEQYPSGLVVGTVEGLFDEDSGISRYATIIPQASLDNLVEVFVIKDFDVEE